jgi:hypothetical protein
MRSMTFDEFKSSLTGDEPAPGLSPLLVAMWRDGKGNWGRAHEIAQDVASAEGSWVHAYLHRKEGDEGNAGYWYGQANQPHTRQPLDAEWEEIVKALLASGTPDRT